jgi:hypothetical protein
MIKNSSPYFSQVSRTENHVEDRGTTNARFLTGIRVDPAGYAALLKAGRCDSAGQPSQRKLFIGPILECLLATMDRRTAPLATVDQPCLPGRQATSVRGRPIR